MQRTLITLAHIHHDLGLIGIDELKERIDVALWLEGDAAEEGEDPRREPGDDAPMNPENDECGGEVFKQGRSNGDGGASQPDSLMEFTLLDVWVFTKSDPDPYPSIPHGHYQNQQKAWPKLNPYTGRVFSKKHNEDVSSRLSKKRMKRIWNDEKFKSFCREMIVWYQQQFPYYEFPVRRPLRMPRWSK